jgi:hypothetical protein
MPCPSKDPWKKTDLSGRLGLSEEGDIIVGEMEGAGEHPLLFGLRGEDFCISFLNFSETMSLSSMDA